MCSSRMCSSCGGESFWLPKRLLAFPFAELRAASARLGHAREDGSPVREAGALAGLDRGPDL